MTRVFRNTGSPDKTENEARGVCAPEVRTSGGVEAIRQPRKVPELRSAGALGADYEDGPTPPLLARDLRYSGTPEHTRRHVRSRRPPPEFRNTHTDSRAPRAELPGFETYRSGPLAGGDRWGLPLPLRSGRSSPPRGAQAASRDRVCPVTGSRLRAVNEDRRAAARVLRSTGTQIEAIPGLRVLSSGTPEHSTTPVSRNTGGLLVTACGPSLPDLRSSGASNATADLCRAMRSSRLHSGAPVLRHTGTTAPARWSGTPGLSRGMADIRVLRTSGTPEYRSVFCHDSAGECC